MIELQLIKEALEEGRFDYMSFSCPGCENIEDEYYTCTTCWSESGTEFRVSDVIRELVKEVEIERHYESIR